MEQIEGQPIYFKLYSKCKNGSEIFDGECTGFFNAGRAFAIINNHGQVAETTELDVALLRKIQGRQDEYVYAGLIHIVESLN